MFRFEEPAKKAFVWGFYHGKYGDAWSMLHILSGTLLAVGSLWLQIPIVFAYTITVLLLFLYELGESAFGIAEDVENAISDVAFGLIGFFGIYTLDNYWMLQERLLEVFIGLSVAALTVLYVGFRSYSAHRKSKNHNGVLRHGRTAESRAAIRRDAVLFFGWAFASTPLLWLFDVYGVVVSLVFFAVVVVITKYISVHVHRRF